MLVSSTPRSTTELGTLRCCFLTRFRLETDFELKGDQPRAIEKIVEGPHAPRKARSAPSRGGNVQRRRYLARERPAALWSNQDQAEQLCRPRFFRTTQVEFFVSLLRLIPPEAYMTATDSYIEKRRNQRESTAALSATRSLSAPRCRHRASVSGSRLERPRLLRSMVALERGARR